MRYLLIALILFGQKNSWANLKVLHFNIKELDSRKIKNVDDQLNAAKSIIERYSFDLLSLNEVQYDQVNVPDDNFKSEGQNLSKLSHIFQIKDVKGISFAPANTGKNALKKPDGTYYEDAGSSEASAAADQVNFGVMPGQYSSGAISKLPITNEIIITDLKWKDFNPNANFSKYRLANGDKIPEDIELFDKNFSDITVQYQGKEVHIILLHTVPSYHFGNMKSINDYRNAEQLRFLEWYLTGATDYPVKLKSLKPLATNSYYIAMGDFNVGIEDKSSEGSLVMQKLYHKTQGWVERKQLSFTNESSHYKPAPLRLMLDYILASPNMEIVKGEIIHPDFERTELGCKTKPRVKKGVVVSYLDDNKLCHALIGNEYHLFKRASDHYPIYGEFKLK